MSGPRVLCLDLTGEPGHVNYSRMVMESLADVGDYVLAAPPDYLDHFDHLQDSIALPAGLPVRGPGLFRHRWNQIARWRAARSLLRSRRFDSVLVLGYEPTTSYLMAPRSLPFWSIEHNTIEQALGSRTKGFCYRSLPPTWRHFVLMEYLLEDLEGTLGRRGAVLPHPLLPVDDGAAEPEGFPVGKRVYFSPSQSNQPEHFRTILTKLGEHPEAVVATKGVADRSARQLLARPRFEDYTAWLKYSYAVCFLGDFSHRVSGVVFDALGAGTPVILIDCAFARALRELYPAAVAVLETPQRIFEIEFAPEAVASDCGRMRAAHSRETLSGILRDNLQPRS